MSTAHRPTWDPAQAKEVKGGSRQFSVRDMASHTKLKFRCVSKNGSNLGLSDISPDNMVKHRRARFRSETCEQSYLPRRKKPARGNGRLKESPALRWQSRARQNKLTMRRISGGRCFNKHSNWTKTMMMRTTRTRMSVGMVRRTRLGKEEAKGKTMEGM